MSRSVPLKRLAELRVERRRSDADGLLTLEVVESGTGRLLADPWDSPVEPPHAGVAEVEAGDVLFGKLRPYLAKVVHVTRPAYASTELLCLRPNTATDPRWFFYRMIARPTVEWAAATSEGTKMPRTSWERLGEFHVHVPALSKQRAIADYLDTETARIDALIAKKRTLSARLAEQFESRVFVAVTAGLREAPLVPSGLDWAPRIPETWGTPTVSANFDVQLGKMLSAEATAGVDQQPYLRNVNVQWDRIDLDDLATMHFSPEEKLKFELKPGDLLVCEGGVVGRAAVWAGGVVCFYQKALHRVRPRVAASTRFLMYALRAAANLNVFAVEGNLSTIVHLTREQLNAHRFPWPPVEEQTEIVEHLDHLALKHEAIRRRLDDQISLLKERRHALITAAVTGELEIPGAA